MADGSADPQIRIDYDATHGIQEFNPNHPRRMMQPDRTPRLYSDLIDLWTLVSPPGEYDEEVATFRARFRAHGIQDGARVLHLGSGGGSIDHHLKQIYDVTGIDISPEMVRHARSINPEVAYHVGDIRTYRLNEVFDAVLVHDAISYMTSRDELAAVYATAAAHLGPGGVMIALPEELLGRVAAAESRVDTRREGDRKVTIVETSYDPDARDNTFHHDFVFIIQNGSDLRVEVDRHVCGAFELADFIRAIENAGFTATVTPWELTEWQPGEEPLPLITAIRKSG